MYQIWLHHLYLAGTSRDSRLADNGLEDGLLSNGQAGKSSPSAEKDLERADSRIDTGTYQTFETQPVSPSDATS